ncbi:MAG: transketolase [Deltaproteobacteria bacterium]|nr:transketolase [Deltaproteobacteria bacterium]
MLKELTPELLQEISQKANQSRGDIIAMTYLAGSGHPGGSLSSIDIYTLLYHVIDMETDRVIISHGHTSPAVYSALARKGLFDPRLAIKGFRRIGSIFEGHVEPSLPGIPWGTGNLGQGLSIACGYAVAARLKSNDMNCFVVMGDGEQQKGQLCEARRFIKKFNLNNITAIIDNNQLQICGERCDVMPQNLAIEYESAGFTVIEIDGHDFEQIYSAINQAVTDPGAPYAIIANTTMGKGISFMENKADYHGRALNDDELKQALPELSLDWPLEELKLDRSEPIEELFPAHFWPYPPMKPGDSRLYSRDVLTDNRSAMGNALLDVAKINAEKPIAVFDCDLAGSVKTAAFGKEFPQRFFQAGIAEHNTAAMAGAASTQNIVSVFADFGMFGIVETYNQQRLNALNNAHLKLFCTHIGVDVGEDGKTHQCIDYLGLMKNLAGFKVIIPIDPNETDQATRWALTNPGNCLIAMGRSKTPAITDESGNEFFTNRPFNFGEAHHLRPGSTATLFALGAMSAVAIDVWEKLKAKDCEICVVGISCPFELDVQEIRDAARKGPVFVIEDHLAISGLASQIAFVAAINSIAIELLPIGITGFPPSGPSKSCLKCFGLDAPSVVERISNRLRG